MRNSAFLNYDIAEVADVAAVRELDDLGHSILDAGGAQPVNHLPSPSRSLLKR